MKSLLIAGVVSVLAVAGMWMGVRRVQAQTSTPVFYPVGPQLLTLAWWGWRRAKPRGSMHSTSRDVAHWGRDPLKSFQYRAT
jgi:hypothetical protein